MNLEYFKTLKFTLPCFNLGYFIIQYPFKEDGYYEFFGFDFSYYNGNLYFTLNFNIWAPSFLKLLYIKPKNESHAELLKEKAIKGINRTKRLLVNRDEIYQFLIQKDKKFNVMLNKKLAEFFADEIYNFLMENKDNIKKYLLRKT